LAQSSHSPWQSLPIVLARIIKSKVKRRKEKGDLTFYFLLSPFSFLISCCGSAPQIIELARTVCRLLGKSKFVDGFRVRRYDEIDWFNSPPRDQAHVVSHPLLSLHLSLGVRRVIVPGISIPLR
jgi:hypothetical protein